MQSAITLHGVSFSQNPRYGQKLVFDEAAKSDRVTAKLPTGYGKTFTINGCYAIKRRANVVNRLLVVVPTVGQLNQYIADCPESMRKVGITDKPVAIDIKGFGVQSINKHRRNDNHIFITTIQAMLNSAIIPDMLSTGKWMLALDEYHHYGFDTAWHNAIRCYHFDFFLALSATPRLEGDAAYEAPMVNMTYHDAVEEKAVKPLRGHVYHYKVDYTDEHGELITMSTDEIVKMAGSESPDAIQRATIDRKLRWSPKYISPLVSVPIERMIRNRQSTGYKLQVLIGAMCVSHAELVVKQVQAMFPHLAVDWVATGARDEEENRRILAKFCPPKNEYGERDPEIDVLVHVAMAGEGLDSVNVSEVVHLNNASINRANLQESGRAARYLEGVVGNINFDGCSGFAKAGYIGSTFMDAMDAVKPSQDDEDQSDQTGETNRGIREVFPPLGEEPVIRIHNIDLDSIDSGDSEVEMFATVLESLNCFGIDFNGIRNDKSHPDWIKVTDGYKTMQIRQTEQFNELSIVKQWKEHTKSAFSSVVSRVVRVASNGLNPEKSLSGDIAKRINARKYKELGGVSNSEDIYKAHYAWLVNLDRQIVEDGIPLWLA